MNSRPFLRMGTQVIYTRISSGGPFGLLILTRGYHVILFARQVIGIKWENQFITYPFQPKKEVHCCELMNISQELVPIITKSLDWGPFGLFFHTRRLSHFLIHDTVDRDK